MTSRPMPASAGISAVTWAATDTWVVARRHLTRMVRRPDDLLGTLLIPVMAIAMFGFVFGNAFGAAMDVPGHRYREFLLPGLFVLTMAFGIGNTTVAVTADVQGGVLDRMRSLPVSAVTLLTGRSLADVITAVVELAILMTLGTMFGWQWHGGLGAGVAAISLLLLLRFALSWVGIVLGLVVSSPESAMKYFSLVFPLAMVADTIVSTSLMPGWLAGLAEWNPLSATVVVVRELFANPTGPATSWVAAHSLIVAGVWPAVITAVCIPVALRRLRRLDQ